MLAEVVALVRHYRDVIDGRVVSPEGPRWARPSARPGWREFLLSLDDIQLANAERYGLPSCDAIDDAPPTLKELCERAHTITAPFTPPPAAIEPLETQAVPQRKRTQVARLVAQVRQRFATPSRIVDLGAGHGHLTRALAHALDVTAVGVDNDERRVSRARLLADRGQFVVADGGDIALEPGDLIVGLHACGSLGDTLVRRAAATRCDALLVSCCLQKIEHGERQPLAGGVSLSKDTLGLTNLSWGDGVAVAMRGRQTRHALRILLATRGVDEPAGKEAHGIQRKRFRRGLAAVATMALERRGLAPASADELRACELQGAREYGLIRRLSLPRGVLGRVIELMVVLDRAQFLASHAVHVCPVFDVDTSPRNLGIFARALC